jgi:hypothetical protein
MADDEEPQKQLSARAGSHRQGRLWKFQPGEPSLMALSRSGDDSPITTVTLGTEIAVSGKS